jgi:hypothetical protein
MPSKGQTFDSAGPDIRVRGNAYQVLEKYLQMARDAGTAGDRIAAENFLQHADHYYRVVAALSEGQRPRIGGREVSVADVNMQNVNQGLSAAMSGHGHSGSAGDDSGDSEPGDSNGNTNGQMRSNQQHSNSQHSNAQHSNSQHSNNQHSNSQHSQGAESGSRPTQSSQGGNVQSSGAAGGDGSGAAAGDAARFGQSDEQPDYPDELLPATGQQAPREAQADGQEGHAQGRGRGRRRGPGRRIRGEGEEAPVPTPPNPDTTQ